jgi:hypothetical protein
MNATEKKTAPRKDNFAALAISCVILAACLGAAIAAYALATDEKNDQISSLNSQISQLNSSYNSTFQFLFSYFSKLQNQSTPVLNLTGATFVSIAQINLDPAKWENRKVIVMGKLSGPYPYFTAISYYYVLSSNETVTSSTELDANSIGVDFGNRGAQWNGSNAIVVGIVKKGTIGTIVQEAKPTTVYYIEEQARTPTSSHVTITTASTPMTISGPETGGATVHVGGMSVFALHENQYVFAWVSITGDNNFSFSGMMTDINPGGLAIRSGEPVPYTPPAIAFAGLFPGAYTVNVVYGGVSCLTNFVLSPDTTVTVTVVF